MTQTLLSINNYYYPRGGAEVVFFRHNEMFEDQGWQVAPFCMQHEKNLPTPWSEDFVESIEYGDANYRFGEKLRKGFKSVYSIEARAKVRKLLDRLHPDICHAHNVYHHITPSILGVLRSNGVPLVMTLHDLKVACPAYSMLSHDGVCERCRRGSLFNVLTNRCMKGSASLSALVMVESYLHRMLGSYAGNVDRFIVPSKFYFNKLVEWGFEASHFDYVPNFVDAAAFEPRFAPGKRVLYFGRLSKEKGIDTLVEAASRAGVGLDLVGDGPIREALQKRVSVSQADVRFHGFMSGDSLHEVIRNARAVVVPSQWYENAPLTVLESFALGKPVIAARIGGLPEQVVDNESGWLFESGSVDDLEKILRMVDKLPDDDLADVGAMARERVETYFSPSSYLEGIRKVYGRMGVIWN